MPFETTDVASKVGGTQFDPAKTIGEYAGIQNQFNQNKLFQAKSLAGQYLAAATGPDGTPDLGKFGQAIQNDSRTGPFAADILADAQALHGAGITNRQHTQDLAASGMANLRKVAGTAGVSSPTGDPTENKKNAVKAILSGIGPLYTQEQATDFLANLGDNIRASAISGDAGPNAVSALTGKPTTVDTGPTNEAVNVNEFTNTRTHMGGDASSIKLANPPSVMASPINVVDHATGTTTQHNYGEYFNADNTLKPGKEFPMVNLGALDNTTRAAYGSALGPAVDQFERQAAAAPNTRNLIEQMRSSVDQFDTGPNSDFWRNIGELANEYHIPFDPNSVSKTSASEVFNKIVPALLHQQATQLGMNDTDTGRQLALATIPTNGLTKEGIKKVLSVVEGNTDAINAQGSVWQQEKKANGPAAFGDFRVDFNRKVPPSVFQSQYMTPAEVKDMQKGWSTAKVADWNKRRDIAKAQGWLPNAQ